MIANFIEEHSKGKFKRTGKEVLNKTKEMQKSGWLLKFFKIFLNHRGVFKRHYINYFYCKNGIN